MKFHLYIAALLAATAGSFSPGGSVRPTNLSEVKAQAQPGKASPACPTQQQRSHAAKMAKRSVGGDARNKPQSYGGGGWTVAEGKRRARRARNRSHHKRACGRRS